MGNKKELDEAIFEMAAAEKWDVPDSCSDYVETLLDNLPDTPAKEDKMTGLPKKRVLLLAAALAAVVGMTAAAAELFSWNEQAVESFHYPTREEQDAMVMDGIAREQKVSATDAGLTVTAIQTLQDKNSLYILLELESEEDIIDGSAYFENLVDGEYAPKLVASDGTKDAFDNIGMMCPPDSPLGELSGHGYYEIFAIKSMEQEWDSDSVTFQFTKYFYDTQENGEDISHEIEGNWSLTIPLTEDVSVHTELYELNQTVEIKGVPVTVKRVELSPLSAILVFDMDEVETLRETLYPDWEEGTIREIQFGGFQYKNGQELEWGFNGMSGKYDYDKREIIHEMSFGRYVDVEQVSAVLLGDEKIPVSLE